MRESRRILHCVCCSTADCFRGSTGIGGNVDGLAIWANRSVSITILGLEVARYGQFDCLAVRERYHVQRAALERGYQQYFVPTGNRRCACAHG